MLSSVKSYTPSRPVHVLHVIGLVGAGKTHFLQKYFPTLPVFNITTIYQEYIISPEDLKCNRMNYLQYGTAVRTAWEEFLCDHDPREDLRATFCVGVESLGINQALNVILVPFFPTILLIHGDPPPLSDEVFWGTHPYGLALNVVLREKLTAKIIPYTHLYDAVQDTFSSLLPHEFCALSPQLSLLGPKSPILTKTLPSPRITKCPTCGAPFFTPRLFTMHLRRHVAHLEVIKNLSSS